MSRVGNSVEDEMVWQGIDQFMLRRTVRIVDPTDDSGGGSGVTIFARGKHFVATASHVLKNGREYGILLRDDVSQLFRDIIGIHRSNSDDVALIELNSHLISSLSTYHDFVIEEDFYLERYPTKRQSLVIVGYPSFAIQKSQPVPLTPSDSVSVISFETLNYDTIALARSTWPKGEDFPTKSARSNDIFCEYRPGEQEASRRDMRGLDRPEVEGVLAQVPLNGMSGCGIWMPHNYIKPSEITYPGAKLVGIQVSYPTHGKGKWLRGVRSRVIVDLLNGV